MILVILLNVLQSIAFFGTVETVLVYQKYFLLIHGWQRCAISIDPAKRNSKITFPVSGFLADVYSGTSFIAQQRQNSLTENINFLTLGLYFGLLEVYISI